VAHSHTPRTSCVRFVFGVAAASRNTRFQAACYADERHRNHDGSIMPARPRFAGKTLSLVPFVAARICSQCGRRDVLLYDSLYKAARGGKFDLLDYARGHKSRLHGAEATDLSDALGDVVPQEALYERS
jgi:hypothetical protein